jgi:hypothetical protein
MTKTDCGDWGHIFTTDKEDHHFDTLIAAYRNSIKKPILGQNTPISAIAATSIGLNILKSLLYI